MAERFGRPGRRGAEALLSGAVTVVIPTRDRRAMLLRTLDSVLGQRDVEVSVVVVDDGGADGSADAVRSLRHPDVTVVRHETSAGVSRARNAGLAAARTPWVAFVDDDDLWAPDKLSSQLAAVVATPGAAWSCVGAAHVDSSFRIAYCAEPPASGDISPVMLRRQGVPGGGSGVLVATALARAVGGFDTGISILADWDFYLRLSLRSPVASVPRPLVGYYVHLDSMYHDPAGLRDELAYLERKYRDRAHQARLQIEYGQWFFTMSQMARRLGRPELSRNLLLEGLVRVPLPLIWQLVRWARRRARRQRTVAPPGWEGEAMRWLARYADEPGDESAWPYPA